MNKWPWLVLCLVFIIVDQVTKYWALSFLLPYESVQLIPMVRLTLAFNTGAAFSFLSGAGTWHHWFFIAFSGLMSLFIFTWIVKASVQSKLLLCSLALILSGAVGNLIDRITRGHVVDFIDVYYHQYHWPVFNVADTVICIGALLLMLDLFKNSDQNSA